MKSGKSKYNPNTGTHGCMNSLRSVSIGFDLKAPPSGRTLTARDNLLIIFQEFSFRRQRELGGE